MDEAQAPIGSRSRPTHQGSTAPVVGSPHAPHHLRQNAQPMNLTPKSVPWRQSSATPETTLLSATPPGRPLRTHQRCWVQTRTAGPPK